MSLSLHHVGVLVKDITSATDNYIQCLGYHICSEIIHDLRQTALVRFLRQQDDHPYLELISPDGPNSLLTNALKKGGGVHHLCYSTADIEKSLETMGSSGFMRLQAPVPAVAFGGRRIAWMMNRDQLLVELVEQGPAGTL